jgi:hypothetical protein
LKSERKRPGATHGEGPKIGHLDTLGGIVKELGNLYREARLGITPVSDATRLAFILKTMRDCIETQVLEQLDARLRVLEEPHSSRSADHRPGTALQ